MHNILQYTYTCCPLQYLHDYNLFYNILHVAYIHIIHPFSTSPVYQYSSPDGPFRVFLFAAQVLLLSCRNGDGGRPAEDPAEISGTRSEIGW